MTDKEMRELFNEIDNSNLTKTSKDTLKHIVYSWRYTKD
jgi:hypothetical protein